MAAGLIVWDGAGRVRMDTNDYLGRVAGIIDVGGYNNYYYFHLPDNVSYTEMRAVPVMISSTPAFYPPEWPDITISGRDVTIHTSVNNDLPAATFRVLIVIR